MRTNLATLPINLHLTTIQCSAPNPKLVGKTCGWRQTESRNPKPGENVDQDGTIMRRCDACGTPFKVQVRR